MNRWLVHTMWESAACHRSWTSCNGNRPHLCGQKYAQQAAFSWWALTGENWLSFKSVLLAQQIPKLVSKLKQLNCSKYPHAFTSPFPALCFEEGYEGPAFLLLPSIHNFWICHKTGARHSFYIIVDSFVQIIIQFEIVGIRLTRLMYIFQYSKMCSLSKIQ